MTPTDKDTPSEPSGDLPGGYNTLSGLKKRVQALDNPLMAAIIKRAEERVYYDDEAGGYNIRPPKTDNPNDAEMFFHFGILTGAALEREYPADAPEEARDPENDPFACSLCGEFLGETKRVRGDDYCDACKREHADQHALRACTACGREAPPNLMESFDASREDDYYPDIKYVCADCAGDATNDATDANGDSQ